MHQYVYLRMNQPSQGNINNNNKYTRPVDQKLISQFKNQSINQSNNYSVNQSIN